jgi:hypothetical protein
MENNKHHIQDDEFRVLGTGSPVPVDHGDEQRRRNKLIAWVSLALVALLGIGIYACWPKQVPQEDEVEGVFESSLEAEAVKAFGTEASLSAYTERLDTLVNGHLLSLFIPHHATPRLVVGHPNDKDRRAILAVQAADIRSDNWEILGEFVLAGTQLSRGVSKKGFCAIIDGKLTLGVGETTPLLSEAIGRGGYFFRQFALVDGGNPVENNLKNKTLRKALCERGGQVFVAVSRDDVAINDFAQLLADLDVHIALYLVGGKGAFGWSFDAEGEREQFGNEDMRPEYRNESYILWD